MEFVYSPLFEMLCSLHVLLRPEHHLERTAWAQRTQAVLPEALTRQLKHVEHKTSEFCILMDLCNIYPELDDFHPLAALEFLEQLPEEVLRCAAARYSLQLAEHIPAGFLREASRVLREYHLLIFEKELRVAEPYLVRMLRRDGERLAQTGLRPYLDGLHQRIEVTGQAVLFHKYTLFTVPFEGLQRVIVRISSFIDPHLLADFGEGFLQVTRRIHLETGIKEIPRDLLGLLQALSDETRLKILRILFRGKGSTQSLARELGLTEACISKHLKVLHAAELLHRERSGNFMYYYLDVSALDGIPLSIYECLDYR